jgi:hypothetical protein
MFGSTVHTWGWFFAVGNQLFLGALVCLLVMIRACANLRVAPERQLSGEREHAT